MQIKETIGVSFPSPVETMPLEGVVMLAQSAGVALGMRPAFNARVRGSRDGGSGVITSKRVDIPLIGADGKISGILCDSGPWLDARGPIAAGGRETVRAIADGAQFVVHDINNLLAVIGSGLRLLERQDDAAYRKAIIGKMQEAITRGAQLSRQILDAARPRPKPIDGFVTGSRLAAMAGTLDDALRPEIAVRSEITPDLWNFNADPEELYFALLNLCRNSTDAMPHGGVITVAARNLEVPSGEAQEFVEIVVADDGEGMPEDVLSQALVPYFTTKPAGSGTGLGLAQVQRFAEGRGGAICIESERGAGTLVRLLLPRAQAANGISRTEIAYTPSPDGGVFHLVNSAAAAPTS